MDPKKVLISEDRPTEQEYFNEKLQEFPDLQIVGQAWAPDEALRLIERLLPDVVLFDLQYDGWSMKSVYDTISEVCRRFPLTRILAFTAFQNLVEDAVAAGCDDVLYKGRGVGIVQVHDRILALARRPRERRITWEDIGATQAENDAFLAYIRTMSTRDAAADRMVSVHTQKHEEVTFREKLSKVTHAPVDTMAKAVKVAIQYGLIDRSDLETLPSKPR